jgi:hypothetical protein
MNYTNQDYMHVNYTLIVVYSMLLVISTHNDGRLSSARPFCPAQSFLCTAGAEHMHDLQAVMTLLHAQRMHALQWPRSVVGRRNVMRPTSWYRRNVIVTSYGSV